MAKLAIDAGTTSTIDLYFIQKTDGTPYTGLAFNSAGLIAYYTRPGAAAVAITLATQTATGAYASGGFVEISAANAPGLYRFDPPDAALAAGVRSTVITLSGASLMFPCQAQYDLQNDANVASLTNVALDSIWQRTFTESYAALHAVPTPTQILFEMRSWLVENNFSGTTATTKKVDGSTTAETFTLNSSTTPTAVTRAS